MREVELKIMPGKTVKGYELSLGAKKFIAVIGQKGYLACGYLNLPAAVRLRDTAAVVAGVNSVEEMLEKEVSDLTPQAAAQGIKRGMRGREALEKLV